MNVIGLALDELYRIFNIMNKDIFDNFLPEPVITIQTTKGRELGHFTLDKVWRDKNNIKDNVITTDENDEQSMYEINIDPRWFYERSAIDIAETLLHEMVHYNNKILGIKDCSGKSHNKKFKEAAESVGLIVTKEKGVGYGITSLSSERESYIKEKVNPNDSVFEYFRAGVKKEEKRRKNKNTFKYTCPKCGVTAKGKIGLHIKCGDCNVNLDMEKVEESDVDQNGEES